MLVEYIHLAWWINIENSVSILNIERYYIYLYANANDTIWFCFYYFDVNERDYKT